MNKENGDCLRVACNNAIDHRWLFCYAKVMGQGKLKGVRFLHAWNEQNNVVFDYSNGVKRVLTKEAYYHMAQIKESDVTRQTPKEVSELLVKYGTYGGWIQK